MKENAHEVAGGTMVGAAAGLLIGLIFPPAFLASGVVGGAIGASIGKLVKMDRTSDIKKEVEDVLPAGTSGHHRDVRHHVEAEGRRDPEERLEDR